MADAGDLVSAPVVLPSLPARSPTQVFQDRKKIRSKPGFIGLLNETLTLEKLKDLHDILLSVLKDADPSALWATLLPLQNRAFTDELGASLSFRMAGARHLLQNGLLPEKWAGQAADEWMAFQVVGADPVSLKPKGDPDGHPVVHARLLVRCLVGGFCPEKTPVIWSLAFMRFLAHRLGFDRGHRGRYFLTDVRQLFGLQFWGWVEAERSRYLPRFRHVEVPPGMRTDNRVLIRTRARDGRSPFVCPKNRPASTPCHLCPTGVDVCPVATHAEEYLFGPCSYCHRQDAIFSGSFLRPRCVECQIQHDLRRQK